MQLDVVNNENKKVGTVDVNDEVFGGRINGDLMWESVVHANAADRSGTHAAKTRAFVSGTGKKPWKQKGTGRAQVGSSRTPLWRHGCTVHPPRPRSYDFKLSKKVELGALRKKGEGASLSSTADELEEVVAETARAANEIMGAAESIEQLLPRVDDAVGAEARLQPVGRAEYAAEPADVLTEDHHPLVALHLVAECLADRLDHRHDRHQPASSRCRASRA